MYFKYYYPRTFLVDKFKARICFAGTRMKGPAADCYEGFEIQLKRSFGLRTKFIKLTNKPSALPISLRKLLKLITANRKENRKEKPRKVAILLNTTHRLTKEKSETTIRFNRTCNACGKKGHKEADYRSKITCGFCAKTLELQDIYNYNIYGSQNPNHKYHGCPDCGSTEGY
ncbi:hypothetical protein MKX08_009612 [Trichoderma sp. CBMAI-0020]|nr:hypothetical protein MKX08_009612 [Trichoderma sp. CBMAI-0020]